MQKYIVTIYRVNSETSVVYTDVKHTWWSNKGKTLVISQLTYPESADPVIAKIHHYWEWPVEQIDHVRIGRDLDPIR